MRDSENLSVRICYPTEQVNDILHEEKGHDVYALLTDSKYKISEEDQQKIAEKFQEHDQLLAAIYTDTKEKDGIKYLRSYDPKKELQETNVFINGKIRQNLQYRQMQDPNKNLLFQIMQQGLLIIHLAEPLVYDSN